MMTNASFCISDDYIAQPEPACKQNRLLAIAIVQSDCLQMSMIFWNGYDDEQDDFMTRKNPAPIRPHRQTPIGVKGKGVRVVTAHLG